MRISDWSSDVCSSDLVKRPEVDPQRVAAIGYCMGGTIALELARSGAELRGVVTFHGGLSTTSQSGTSIRAKVLVCTGADDPAVPVEQRNAFEDEKIGRASCRERGCQYV